MSRACLSRGAELQAGGAKGYRKLARGLGRPGWALLAALLGCAAGDSMAGGAPDPQSERFLHDGLELLLKNDYATAEAFFKAEARRRPDEALPLVALMFSYQLQMYEMDDFSREREFSALGEKALELAWEAMRRRRLAWDRTMEASVYGMQGLQAARKERWLHAARLGLKAKTALDKALEADPGFADAYLGRGVYRYYASVLTKKYWFLPGFGDQRREGLEDVHHARRQGVYLGAVAEFALLYIDYDERRYGEAMELAQGIVRRWPQNALGQSWLGWMQMKLGRFGEAGATFARLCAGGAKRHHCLYHLGYSRLLEGRDPQLALEAFQAFLATAPRNWWRARAYYRSALAQLRLGRTEAARSSLRAASFIDPGYKLPRERLAILEREEAAQAGPPRPAKGVPAPLAGRRPG